MGYVESDTHSFIIKIWLEETAKESARARWRGHITHIPSGYRRYFKSLDEVSIFIIPYLKARGVKFGLPGRMRAFLTKWVIRIIR
jgi:hypothetical protein